ncbi:MAG: GyrI-like domain-containing protein [Bacteroidota bacterium]
MFSYIEHHLDSDVSLGVLAEVAFFSPFHFHRVFKFITGETVNEYITRQRIERSASDLLHTSESITRIAHTYGFGDSASFSKTFKKFYGLSPSAFRNQHPNRFSKIRPLYSKNGQEYPEPVAYLGVIDQLTEWIHMNATIKTARISHMDLAYVLCIGDEHIGTAYQKLIQWATSKNLMNDQTKLVTLYHDSFKITEASNVKMSAAIVVNTPVETDGEIGLTSIHEGECIVGSFEIGLQEFEQAWTGMFVWMEKNGFKKADRYPFEIYHNNFNEHPEKKAIVDFYIPIE